METSRSIIFFTVVLLSLDFGASCATETVSDSRIRFRTWRMLFCLFALMAASPRAVDYVQDTTESG
jgi:hypothetical protein